jgi:multidrug resistance efflux pump
MEVLLLAIYAFFVWLIFFKFKWLRWTMTAAVVVITLPIMGLVGLLLLLNVYAPSALDVQVLNYVVQVLPRVTGRVTEVPVEPNRLTKKGDVLFRIDPRPFQYEVDRLEAQVASTRANVGAQREEVKPLKHRLTCRFNRVASIKELRSTRRRHACSRSCASGQTKQLADAGAGISSSRSGGKPTWIRSVQTCNAAAATVGGAERRSPPIARKPRFARESRRPIRERAGGRGADPRATRRGSLEAQ